MGLLSLNPEHKPITFDSIENYFGCLVEKVSFFVDKLLNNGDLIIQDSLNNKKQSILELLETNWYNIVFEDKVLLLNYLKNWQITINEIKESIIIFIIIKANKTIDIIADKCLDSISEKHTYEFWSFKSDFDWDKDIPYLVFAIENYLISRWISTLLKEDYNDIFNTQDFYWYLKENFYNPNLEQEILEELWISS